jgi:hypothetical protein
MTELQSLALKVRETPCDLAHKVTQLVLLHRLILGRPGIGDQLRVCGIVLFGALI